MKIGLIIKQLMIQENIEISELAKKMKRSKQAIYDMLEKDDVNTSILRELSSILNIPITDFFKEDNLTSIRGDSNLTNSGDNNSIHVGGSVVNVTLPPEGSIKILKADGTVEMYKEGQEDSSQLRIKELENIIKMKDEIINSKNETIEAFRSAKK